MRLHLYKYRSLSPDLVSDRRKVILQEFRNTFHISFHMSYFTVLATEKAAFLVGVNSEEYKA